MPDGSVVHIGENSPEYVAYRLMESVAHAEGKTFFQEAGMGTATADRQWILDTYAECLKVVRGHRTTPEPSVTEP